MEGPLAGTRVIDAGMNIAGPCAATILANLGAEVIKIEAPGGDRARAYPPLVDGIGTLFAAMNQNKRFVGLDLTREDGREVLGRLVATADALVHNVRPGKDTGLGLAPDQCHNLNPRLVHCAIEAFYPDEPGRPGYDLLVQAESGILDLTGEPDGGPCRLPGSIIDEVSGLWAATGVLGALHGARDRATVTVTLMDVAMWMLGDKVSTWLANGNRPQRLGSQLSTTTPLGAYRAADGWLVIGAATDAMFGRLAAILGPPVDDSRFASQTARLEHRGSLTAAIEGVLATNTVDTWFQRLEQADVPVARVRELPEAAARHAAASRTGVARPEVGPTVVAPPIVMSAEPFHVTKPAVNVGRDTDAVLQELGIDAEHRSRLKVRGAVTA